MIDASTVLAAVLRESHTASARAFLQQLQVRDELVAPGLLLAECTSNIRELVFTGALTEAEAREALERTLSLPTGPVVAVEQHRLALEIAASRRSRKAYDSHYLAVAAILGAEIVTIDGGMYQGAVEHQIPARLLQ